jgi:hypothetical protein
MALLLLVRQRWAIEYSLHWVHDVPLRKYAHRYWDGNAVQIMTMLASLTIKVLLLDRIWSITEGVAPLAHDIKGLLRLLGWQQGDQNHS